MGLFCRALPLQQVGVPSIYAHRGTQICTPTPADPRRVQPIHPARLAPSVALGPVIIRDHTDVKTNLPSVNLNPAQYELACRSDNGTLNLPFIDQQLLKEPGGNNESKSEPQFYEWFKKDCMKEDVGHVYYAEPNHHLDNSEKEDTIELQETVPKHPIVTLSKHYLYMNQCDSIVFAATKPVLFPEAYLRVINLNGKSHLIRMDHNAYNTWSKRISPAQYDPLIQQYAFSGAFESTSYDNFSLTCLQSIKQSCDGTPKYQITQVPPPLPKGVIRGS
eukprot:1192538-Prorocentrum_minimum.AAC.2